MVLGLAIIWPKSVNLPPEKFPVKGEGLTFYSYERLFIAHNEGMVEPECWYLK